jgi:hypothetical protein
METTINSGIGTIRRCPQSAIIMQLISLQLVTNKSRAIKSNSQIYATKSRQMPQTNHQFIMQVLLASPNLQSSQDIREAGRRILKDQKSPFFRNLSFLLLWRMGTQNQFFASSMTGLNMMLICRCFYEPFIGGFARTQT